MQIIRPLLFIAFAAYSVMCSAQTVTIRGQALDLEHHTYKHLELLVITGYNFSRSNVVQSVMTDSNGRFQIKAALEHEDRRILLYPTGMAGFIALNPPDTSVIDLGKVFFTTYSSEFSVDSICDFSTDSLIGNISGPNIDSLIQKVSKDPSYRMTAYKPTEKTLSELNNETGEQCTYSYRLLTFFRDLSKD